MTVRTILTAVSGGSASEGALETACRLARRFQAHLEALHIRVDERQAALAFSDGFSAPMAGDLLQRIADEAAAAAAAAKRSFDTVIARHGLPLQLSPPAPVAGKAPVAAASAAWREDTGYAPDLVAERGRMFDLIVLGRSDRVIDQPHSETVEDAVLRSGRPVLLAPAKVAAEELGRVIGIGWNGSAEAVRAVVAALPFLATAHEVHVITIGQTEEGLGAQAVEYLAWHGIPSLARFVRPVEKVGPGEQLLAEARDVDADLLVMGGYGHTPWRELLFGGATRQVVGTSLMPLLLAH